MAKLMTVGEVLAAIRNGSNDPFGTGPNVIIYDEERDCTYSGSVAYFMFNGAYDYLRERKVRYYNKDRNIVYLEREEDE